MQVARTSRKLIPERIRDVDSRVAFAAASDPDAFARMVEHARHDYLLALPIAAAVIEMEAGRPLVAATNPQFELLAGASLASAGCAAGAMLDRFQLTEPVREFMLGQERAREFAWDDGENVGGRYFIVRLSRLTAIDIVEPRCFVALLDRTAEVETERSLRAEMLHDSLTGLPNRVAFNEAVESAIDQEGNGGGAFAVLVVDLTRFSRVNECMGSLAGDELIITVARRLVSALRTGDVLARLGGDEFGILLRLTDGPGDALHAARRIQATLSAPFRLSDVEIRVDCAVGCALMSDRISISEDLVRNAQFAMKRAKVSRRVEVYQPGEVVAARRRFSIETELRRAIERDELRLAYQPLIDLETGRVAGFEALARWTHPERGEISPVEFIPVAEESGLIVPLGRWALSSATTTLADWDRVAGRILPIYVGVNVSAVQLHRDDIVAAVRSALDDSGLAGDRLTLELTESCIIADPERAMRVLHELKAFTAKIAMDDFGTGYSSLAYLQRLPIDILKIDRSFVTGMLADRDSVAIVRAVLSLADALGMQTTAEGVETVELAQTLAALGCACAQGFHFARPLKSRDAFAYLLERNA
jgi:diguanylate cyclase (GGDEF)-like protein